MFRTFVTLAALTSVLACPEHDFNIRARDDLGRRATAGSNDWSYADPSAWGSIKSEYAICSSGKMQSPINLGLGAYSSVQAPTFAYTTAVTGSLSNWGFGPSFAVDNMNGKDKTGNPSFTANGVKFYLSSWHTHTPSEHSFGGEDAEAEIHLVHTDATGANKGVVGIPITTGASSSFFATILAAKIPGLTSSASVKMTALDMSKLLSEGGNLKNYWTYKGSLTTPPCSEGLRWWVSGKTMTVTEAQMTALLAVSEYSSRGQQKIQSQALGL